MCNFRNGIDIGDIAVGITQRLQIDSSGVIPDGIFHFLQIMGIDKRRLDAILGQRVSQQVKASAVNRLLCDDVPTIGSQRLYGIGHRRSAGGQSQCSASAFQCSQPFFQHVLRGIGQAAVDIARIPQPKPVCRMLTVMEYIRRGLINRDSPGIGCRIGLFLSNVQL